MIGGSYHEEPDSQSRRDVEIVSSNAPDKRPNLSTDEGRGKIRAMLDGIEEVFLSDIARGRGVPVSTVNRDFGAGGTMSARQAKEVGLIAKVEAGGLAAILARLAKPVRSATSRLHPAAPSPDVHRQSPRLNS